MLTKIRMSLIYFIAAVCIASVWVQATSPTLPPGSCALHSTDCDACLSQAKCLWCGTDKTCKDYPKGHILPRSSDCVLDDARWGVCWVNFKVLLIVMGVIGGILILSLTICICYCCFCRNRKKNRAKYEREEARLEQQKQERKNRSDERRSERKARNDEIRRKYGLIKDNTPYQKFEDEA